VLRAVVLALIAAALPPAAASAGRPTVATCALGTQAADLRGFERPAVARAERAFAARHRSHRARRAFATGVAAYVYGAPPLSISATVRRFPVNRLVSIAQLVTPEVRTVVAPNHDTAYSVGRLDLAAGPMVFDVPDTAGRYYVLQFLDAYSNTIDYIGRRTTGTRAGSYAVVPPGYAGPLPTGVRRIESPTKTVWVLGRTLVRDAGDLAAIVPGILSAYGVTPLDDWAAGDRQAPLVLPAFPPDQTRVRLPRGLAFYDALGAALAEDPPPRADACALRAFAAAGIGAGMTPSREARGPARAALRAAPRAGARIVAAAVRRSNHWSRRRNNGWSVGASYVGDYGRNYLGRAAIAQVALGANTPPETVYAYGFSDSRGRPLGGARRYTLRFRAGRLPPVDAFWSLTMYDGASYLHPNALKRYAIGDRTAGLRRGRGGSLTLYLQSRPPRGRRRANWLPAPRGRFRVIMRLYEPRRSVLSGAWRPPPLERR
jgi:hypothetical protein